MLDLVLKPGREKPVLRRHPWVMSGAVADVGSGDEAPGAWTRVLSSHGRVLGYGDYSPASKIRVRIFSFGPEAPVDGFLAGRIADAVARRIGDPLVGDTNAVRLVNAEGDGLPGLIVDRYDDVAVVKLTTAGMAARRDAIASAIREATGVGCGFERADATAARREGMAIHDGTLWGELARGPIPIRERDRCFRVDVEAGQKTGFYLDQRDSRDLVSTLSRGKRVLDLFSYTGGFAVAAARGDAADVTLVDSSAPALERAREHLAENAPGCHAVFEKANAFELLRASSDTYDLLSSILPRSPGGARTSPGPAGPTRICFSTGWPVPPRERGSSSLHAPITSAPNSSRRSSSVRLSTPAGPCACCETSARPPIIRSPSTTPKAAT